MSSENASRRAAVGFTQQIRGVVKAPAQDSNAGRGCAAPLFSSPLSKLATLAGRRIPGSARGQATLCDSTVLLPLPGRLCTVTGRQCD